MGGFTIYRINYPATRREEVLFGANLSIRNVMLECMLKAHTDGFKAGLVSSCPDCVTSIVQCQSLLRAAEDTLHWLKQLPSSVQAFTDLITTVSGDEDYERRWTGGYTDRQVAEARFSQLVQTMRECGDEFLYLQDDHMVCEHEDWYAPEQNGGSKSIINEQGPGNVGAQRGQNRWRTAPSMTMLWEPLPATQPGGFAIHRMSQVETLFRANLAVRNVMLECMRKAKTDAFGTGLVSECPNRACMSRMLKRQPLLKAAEKTLEWLKQQPPSVQDFTDMMAEATGDHNYKRRWTGGYTDRQVAEMAFPDLVHALSECSDEMIYLEDQYMVCAHENWRRPK